MENTDYWSIVRKVECYARELQRFYDLNNVIKSNINDYGRRTLLKYVITCCQEYQKHDKDSFCLTVIEGVYYNLCNHFGLEPK